MKKLKYLITCLLIIGMAVLTFVGCGGKALVTPSDFTLDENSNLLWSAVPSASSYSIEITNIESGDTTSRTSRRTRISLYTLKEGDYEIKVKAIAGNTGNRDSKWSTPFSYHRDYETGCIYTLINNNTEYEVTKVGTASGKVILEDTYRGLPLTSIADKAFRGNGRINEIVMGKNLTHIGASAFANCSRLTSVVISDSVTEIGDSAFQNCRALTSVTIPDSVTEIKSYTFSYCRGLTEITIGQNVTTIGERALADCSALVSLEIPDSVTRIDDSAFAGDIALESIKLSSALTNISQFLFQKCSSLKSIDFGAESKVQTIEERAFFECTSLSQIELPKALTEIQTYAFWGCSALDNIKLPQSLNHIGTYAFAGTKEYQSQIDAEEGFLYIDNWLVYVMPDTRNTLTTIDTSTFREGIVGIADEVFLGAAALTSITFPQSMKYVGQQAFHSCQQLYRLIVPDNSVEELGFGSFAYCGKLRLFVLGEGLKSFKPYTFYGCSLLESIDIPRSITEIGIRCFDGTALANKADDYGVIYAGDWVVGYDPNKVVSNIVLKDDTRGIADYAFSDCATVRNITGAGISNARYIGTAAFRGCTSLASLSLNDNISEIKDYTFYKCNSLFFITLPANLTRVGRSAFYQCSRLSEIDFSSSLIKEIGDYAFYGCTNVKNVNLGRRLESIGYCAFYNCISIQSVSLPNTVSSLGDRAFYGCAGLKSMQIGTGINKIGDYTFGKCESLETVAIPSNVQSIGDYAFYRATALKSITFGENVKSIGNYAFYGASSLTQLTLPEALTSIGRYAFRNCNKLSSLTVHGAVRSIGMHAFQGCQALTVYTDAEEAQSNWNVRWNSSYRPVVWGCTLSENGEYVLSVTIGENTLENSQASSGIVNPYREGYTFVGWTTTNGGEAEYTNANLTEIEAGTTLYAVWVQSAAPSEAAGEQA